MSEIESRLFIESEALRANAVGRRADADLSRGPLYRAPVGREGISRFVLGLILVVLIAPWAGPALTATDFAVDSTVDAVDASPGDGSCDDGGGACTLRAAIMETNSLAGADGITLPAGTFGLTLAGTSEDGAATGDLDITDDLTLNGAGEAATIVDGGALDMVFHVDPAQTGITVSLSLLTVQNGANTSGGTPGGGILSRGTLSLSDCTIQDSSSTYGGGGLYNLGGTLTVSGCSITGNTTSSGSGGGIVNGASSTLILTGSTVSGNTASSQGGGGLANYGTATILGSSITGNLISTTSGTAGIKTSGTSLTVENSTISSNNGVNGTGAVEVSGGTATLISSTVSSNQGSSALVVKYSSSTLNLVNSTISANYGGLYNGGAISVASSGTLNLRNATVAFNQGPTSNFAAPKSGGITNSSGVVNLRNSIVAGNSSATGQPDCMGTLTSEGYNLLSSLGGCALTGDTTGNITGVSPRLVALADNGGPTMTVALGTVSPAIDGGHPGTPGSGGMTCEAIDQRGLARPRNGDGIAPPLCDMGAYETQHQVFTYTVNSGDDSDDGACDGIHCSLREAILTSNATSTGIDTIAFDIPGAGPHLIQPSSALPSITDPVVIDGYTQSGASANSNGAGQGSNAVLMVEIDGSGAGTGVSGLVVNAGYTTIRGLAVNRYVRSGATGGNGVELVGNSHNAIEGCFLGTDVTGTIDQGNQNGGLSIASSSSNTIGGPAPAARNVVSGNDGDEIRVYGSLNVVQGNLIGTNSAGSAVVETGGQGVHITGGSGNLVGGDSAAAGNLISGNGYGVHLEFSTSSNTIRGNVIGPDITGAVPLGGGTGIYLEDQVSGTVIGGSSSGQGNLISGNLGSAIRIWGATIDAVVQGNLIGVAADGVSSMGNGYALTVGSSASGVQFGGAAPGAGNVVAHNGAQPPPFGPESAIVVSSGSGVDIHGNRIHSNLVLGIDLGNDGVTANDAGDADSGANGLQNYPLLTAVSAGGSTVEGTLNSVASTAFRVDFFANTACDASGYGEGETFLGSDTVTTDATGNVTFVSTPASSVPPGAFVTTTATDPGGNTSEFSPCLEFDPGFVDLALTKEDGGVTGIPGGLVSYTLGFSNDGSLAASGVELVETVPANTVFDPASSTGGWACSPDQTAGSTCTFAVGALPSAGSGAALFAVQIDSPLASGVDQIANTASIADDGSSGADPNTANNSAGDTTPVDAAPDLALTKDDGAASASPGALITYTLSYANNGDQDATGVELTETVPADSSFDVAGSTAGWICAPDASAGSTCTLAVGGVAVGGGGGVASFAVLVAPVVPAGVVQISNTASIADDGANGADPDPSDNTDSDTTPIDASPDLSLVKDDGGSLLPPGFPITYSLQYANNGDQDATGVELTETVPEHTTFDPAASTAGWSCLPDNSAGSTCTLSLGSLAGSGGGTAVFEVDVEHPLPPGVEEISNTASVADDGSNGADPSPGDNSSSEATDALAPTITNIDTETGTGDGQLLECETAAGIWISRVLVSFREDMQDPPGDADLDDVTNPFNYMLVSPGPDQEIDTLVCGPTVGDDLEIVISGVTYDPGSDLATLELGGALDGSLLRLMACGSTTLRDLAGRPLDGDGDGLEGDDFVLTFRTDPLNQLANGHLDCSLSGWDLSETLPGAIGWSADDAASSSLSGSASIFNPSATGTTEVFSLSQCAPVLEEWGHLLHVRFKLTAAAGETFALVPECEFFDQADCLGTSLGLVTNTFAVEGSAGAWDDFGVGAITPPGSASVSCRFGLVTPPSGVGFEAFMDEMSLTLGVLVFEDGFESGDTTAWSDTSP